jgi:hypothetical protein
MAIGACLLGKMHGPLENEQDDRPKVGSPALSLHNR